MKFNDYIQNLVDILKDIEGTDDKGKKMQIEDVISNIIKTIKETNKLDGKVIFIGNGGSDSIASHGAIDFVKNLGIKAICLNNSSMLTCFSNDYGYEHVFEKSLEILLESKDLLIAISSSGNSKNIINAVNKAKHIGAKIITLSGFEDSNELRKLGSINAYIPSSEYGMVELSHQIVIHMITDNILHEK